VSSGVNVNRTEKRKKEHVDIAVKENVRADYNFWDDVRLVHNALPEIDMDEIDLSTNIFDRELGAPVIISGMTGGYREGKRINEILARVAEKYRIGMGVGSQRSALENENLKDTYAIVKEFDVPLKIANIGASQIVQWDKKMLTENIEKIIDMIDADALAICLNFLQEVIQPEGETHARGCIDAIDYLTEEFGIPIIVKETGAGISGNVAKKLSKLDIAGIDIGGYGGTSFAAIEYYRAKMMNSWLYERLGKTFWDWGIPAPISLMEVLEVVNDEITIIASGGIRNGLDVAKAIALGADCAGIAYTMLKAAVEGLEEAMREMKATIEEIRSAMFLVGAGNVEQLKSAEVELWI